MGLNPNVGYTKKQLIRFAQMNKKTLWWALTNKGYLYIIDDKEYVGGNHCLGPFLTIEEAKLAAQMIGWK